MTTTTPLRIGSLLLLALGLVSCGGPGPGSVPAASVEIVIDDALKSQVRVTEKTFKKPGSKNPIEVSVTFENAGAGDQRVLLDGKWQNEAGQGFGGASDSRVIPAGSTTIFTAGTRSQSVTRFLIRVSPTTLNSEQLAAKTMSQVKPAVPGYGLSYTATPSLEQIPNWRPKGTANGAPFVAGTMFFAPINGVWKLQIIDREIDPLKGLALARSLAGNAGLQSIHLNLPDEPEAAKVFDRKLSFGGGHFQIQQSPGSAQTTSWNTDVAWVVEIEQWQRHPYDEAGGTFQIGGVASGRFYVCFKGSAETIQDSFVAGVFEDAPIVYYGAPTRKFSKLSESQPK